jgi:hypothetical protein
MQGFPWKEGTRARQYNRSEKLSSYRSSTYSDKGQGEKYPGGDPARGAAAATRRRAHNRRTGASRERRRRIAPTERGPHSAAAAPLAHISSLASRGWARRVRTNSELRPQVPLPLYDIFFKVMWVDSLKIRETF